MSLNLEAKLSRRVRQIKISATKEMPMIAAAVGGCTFMGRCPVAMAECARAVPPLFRTTVDRAVACYCYKTAPELAAADLGTVLVGMREAGSAAAGD